MNIILKNSIKIKTIYIKRHLKINNYINNNGIIIGTKNIKGQYVYIIEFKDYTRIWMQSKELEII